MEFAGTPDAGQTVEGVLPHTSCATFAHQPGPRGAQRALPDSAPSSAGKSCASRTTTSVCKARMAVHQEDYVEEG